VPVYQPTHVTCPSHWSLMTVAHDLLRARLFELSCRLLVET
jgi:hypothetical protein